MLMLLPLGLSASGRLSKGLRQEEDEAGSCEEQGISGNYSQKKTKCTCIGWVPLKAEPETRIWVQVVYLGGDVGKHQQGVGEVRQRREGSP